MSHDTTLEPATPPSPILTSSTSKSSTSTLSTSSSPISPTSPEAAMALASLHTPLHRSVLKLDTQTPTPLSHSLNVAPSVDVTPLPSPSISPAGSAALFKTFNGHSVPAGASSVTRQSSLRRPLGSTPSQRRSISVGSPITTQRRKALGTGEDEDLSQALQERINTTNSPPSRPAFFRSASGEIVVPKRAAKNGNSPTAVPPSSGRVFEAYDRDMYKSTWREMKSIGAGAFSTVVLAGPAERYVKSEYREYCNTLVAVKLMDMTKVLSRDGNGRERFEAGLKREIEILESVSHPSIINLYAFNIDATRALLVMPYCAGGDLYNLASNYRNKLSLSLMQRVFAETVRAVAHLHANDIVHRDIKLENILIKPALSTLFSITDFESYTQPIVKLTDMGLSRKIDPLNPLLTTRCGSEDYVPPEIIMDQPYDGRQSDAWALGVVLYALLESKLPFDPPLHASRTRRAAHRIARVDWAWDALNGDCNPNIRRAKEIVSGCLQRRNTRWSVGDILMNEWIRDTACILEADDDEWIGNIFIS